MCVCIWGRGVQQLITVSRSNIFLTLFSNKRYCLVLGERINRESPGSHVADIYLTDAGHGCQVPPIFFHPFQNWRICIRSIAASYVNVKLLTVPLYKKSDPFGHYFPADIFSANSSLRPMKRKSGNSKTVPSHLIAFKYPFSIFDPVAI